MRRAVAAGSIAIALLLVAAAVERGSPPVHAGLWPFGNSDDAPEEGEEADLTKGYCCSGWTGSGRCYKATETMPCKDKSYKSPNLCAKACKAQSVPEAKSSSVRRSTSSALPEKKCFVCHYAGLLYDGKPWCDQATEETACTHLRLPDGTRTKDCRWSEGKCISRFMWDCQRRGKESKADEIYLLEEEEEVSTLGDKLKQCTALDYLFRGHSSDDYCEHHVGSVSACVDLAPSCRNFTGVIEGCLTFKNNDAAVQYVEEKIQNKLKPGVKLTIEGNQSVSNPLVCSTRLKLHVTCDGIKKEFEACHERGAPCFGRFGNATVNCTRAGAVSKEICCYDDKWYPGESCPAKVTKVMDEKHHQQGDKCEAGSRAATCDEADKTALEQAKGCVKRGKEWCKRHRGKFSSGTCQTKQKEEKDACESTTFCPWTCAGIPPGEDE